ncbi:MAG TPA: aminotransferase class III-fold pyridoxal phosphate-dependent enzyme [Acidimicrobiales bacterium]|nr:aminotransferase class III-fold pyridoxal phosphate-dependent enzyme [Acidimicrobiales bacterium]
MTRPSLLHPFAKPAADAASYLPIVRGDGARVWDAAGNEYVDALASLWYCQVGHGRDSIVDAIAAQARTLAAFHTFERFTNEPADRLADLLCDPAVAPMPDPRVFLTSGGSEAVDSAIKLARVAHFVAGDTTRTLVISRSPSYHGVTLGAVTLTGLPLNRAGFGPLVGDVTQVPWDDLDAVDEVLAHSGDRVAAIVAEPVVGAGGVLPPPPGYLEGLRRRCDDTGAFLIADEVICGFGRLGDWFASRRYGVEPDLATFAKGVTSGYQPVGGVFVGPAVRGRLEADPAFVLRHGHTYSGHPTACAAAIANVGILRDEDLAARADGIGARLAAGLATAAGDDLVVDVRGAGAVWAAELRAGVDAVAVRDEMLTLGVIARPLGAGVVAFCPPLVIGDAEIDRCVDAFGGAVRAVAARN